MIPKYKICTRSPSISILMLKRVAQPFIFGLIYFLAVSVLVSMYGKDHSSIAIALITLGVMGSLYLFLFYLVRSGEFLYQKVKIKIIDVCIAKVRSVDYGDTIYYPYVKYEYNADGQKYISDNVCLDSRSCYLTVWYENEYENKGLAFAQEKIDNILSLQTVYILKLIPSISYLDISLSDRRKKYFYVLQIVSVVLIVLGFYFSIER